MYILRCRVRSFRGSSSTLEWEELMVVHVRDPYRRRVHVRGGNLSLVRGVSKLKGLDLGEESLQLGLHCGIGLIGGSEFGGVLCGCGCAFVLIDSEVRNHLIQDGFGVVESQFAKLFLWFI